MVLRNILRQWFATGKKPTADQFSEFFDSFWHKSEDKIRVQDVENLQTTLANKEPLIGSKNSAFNKNFGTTPGTVSEGDHGHELNQVNGLSDALASKVDKVAGEGLTPEKFTLEEKQKLAGLESSHFKGLYPNLAALQASVPAGEAGDYAHVDAGVGSDVTVYIWDVSDAKWLQQQGAVAGETAASIKQKYESNADTNAFTDAEKTKLAGLNKLIFDNTPTAGSSNPVTSSGVKTYVDATTANNRNFAIDVDQLRTTFRACYDIRIQYTSVKLLADVSGVRYQLVKNAIAGTIRTTMAEINADIAGLTNTEVTNGYAVNFLFTVTAGKDAGGAIIKSNVI